MQTTKKKSQKQSKFLIRVSTSKNRVINRIVKLTEKTKDAVNDDLIQRGIESFYKERDVNLTVKVGEVNNQSSPIK